MSVVPLNQERQLLGKLLRVNWALVLPYFEAVKKLPADEKFIHRWTLLAGRLAQKDIDVGLAFLKQTPKFLETLEFEEIWTWGQQALIPGQAWALSAAACLPTRAAS